MVIRIWSKKGALFPPTPPAVMKNYMTTIDNRFGISYKLNIHTYTYIYIITTSNSSRNLTKRNENICVKEDLSMKAHHCLIHNCLKQEITPKSITKWLGEQISVYLLNGILLSKKKVPGHKWNSQIYWAKKPDTRVNALLEQTNAILEKTNLM